MTIDKERKMADETCFIIMPITTPDYFIEKYRDGDEHFSHVLECLFVPSVEKAGYKPIAPIAKGSDLIHAEIIQNLEQSDLVLCDMSCLNPNVFFEFGIRTSLNKPVCIVKDEHTKRVPFDTGILNHLEYRSTIEPWELSAEIEKLAEHVRTSHDRSKGENALWKYFGLRTEARAYEGETGTDAKLDYLTMQMESLQKQLGAMDRTDDFNRKTKIPERIQGHIYDFVFASLPSGVTLESFYPTFGGFICNYIGTFPFDDMDHIIRYVKSNYGLKVKFKKIPVSDEASEQQEN